MTTGSKETVSVCLPVFNGGAFLAEAIESVLRQSHREFELLVVDDCSTDDSVAVIERYAATDSRIALHRNQRNLGLVDNWNRCLQLASGQWIKFLFQDDLLAPTCIASLLTAAAPDEQIIACRRTLIGSDSIPVVATGFYADHARLLAQIFSRNTYLGPAEVCRLILDYPATNLIGEPTSVMFRAGLEERFGAFNTHLVMECDSEWWYRVAVNTGIRLVDAELASFRLHGDSASSTAHAGKHFRYRYLDRLVVLRQMAFHAAFQPLREIESREPGRNTIRYELVRSLRAARRYIARLCRKDPEGARQCETELGAMLSLYPDMNLPWYAEIQEKLRMLLRSRTRSMP